VVVTFDRRRVGRRGPEVTRLGLGCAPLGNLYTTVAEVDAAATVDAAWEAGIRYFDTAPLYGHGLAESRLGRALARRPRDEYVLSTKVGRRIVTASNADTGIFAVSPDGAAIFDFSRDGVRRSLEESLERLGLDRVDIVLVHDPDDHEAEALAGAFPALLELRDQGVVGAIGAGMNQHTMLQRFVARVDLDCVLLAGRYTLLDRSGSGLLDICADRSVGVILGGVFNSGVLARPEAGATYDYGEASPSVVQVALGYQEIAIDHGIPLPALALQFALQHPAVTAVVVGARSAEEVSFDAECAILPVPDAVWRDLI
jgi:D-threo-aldose 1-dehydrogenase